ncbi:hypothetical protein JW960_07005 [candidate division KSB1 bacterium]|nr:hypothetical protein [candidate division KSB1 bacterium]
MKPSDMLVRPVSYLTLSPGFEAVYTGKQSTQKEETINIITTISADKAGNEIIAWPVFPWTWPGKEIEWDDEIKHLNKMQQNLDELDDDTRQIRAHIGSLVPCDSGFPITVDELLQAIGTGKLTEPSFKNGCWCSGFWWKLKKSQPRQNECMQSIYAVLERYCNGSSMEVLTKQIPQAASFIGRMFAWLGPHSTLKDYQQSMLRRVLLTIEFFASNNPAESLLLDANALHEQEQRVADLFGDEGQGAAQDRIIAEQAGLPAIHPRWKPEFQTTLNQISDPEKQKLYQTCCAIASGVHTLSDCHHNTFRYIESWIHGIGTGRLKIPSRRSGTEHERLGRLLFGYVLALDKWLLGVPMPFLLLDLGHIDFGFDPKNEILRTYAWLGEQRTPVKKWLAACLWHNLSNSPIGGNPGGLVRHPQIVERAAQAGIRVREWMDGALTL